MAAGGGLTLEQWRELPLTERTTRARQAGLVEVVQRKPVRRDLTPEELQGLEGKDRYTRLTEGQALQHTPKPEGASEG